jgi:hypothetical protein
MIFKGKKYKLDVEDRLEDLSLLLWMCIFFSYAFFICSFGAFVNIGVVMNNGGRMPVFVDYNLSTDSHFSFQDFDSVKYPYLSDTIRIEVPFSSDWGMISVRDISIYFSFLLMLSSVIFFSIKGFKFRQRIKIKYANQDGQLKGRDYG